MTYRIRVEHDSRYRYASTVHSSFNEARITPLTTLSQLVLESRVDVEPHAPALRYVDYWGTIVHSFDISQSHRELHVVGRSLVETSPYQEPTGHLRWTDLHDNSVRDRFAEFLAPSAYVPAEPRLLESAWRLQAEYEPAWIASAVTAWVRDHLRYVSGTTGVHTSAIEAWDGGEGVCQDFAHLAIAILRAAGVPARYCSGYVHPDEAPNVGSTHDGQSHAWLEAWTGEWHAFDPTHDQPVAERHVLVARGRDYGDVAPLKGIFHGGPTAALDVSVRFTRLA